MTPPPAETRDPARPADYFEHFGRATRREMDATLEGGNRAMFVAAADYCRRIARAAYSAGSPVEDCRGCLRESADYLRRYFVEGVTGKLKYLDQFNEYLEGFAAASLVGQGKAVIEAFEAVRPATAHPWDRALLNGLEAVLLRRPLPDDPEGFAAASRQKEYAHLPELFDSITRRDAAAFTQALETYLRKTWGPPSDRAAKAALARPYPAYPGKWSLFAAAACGVMGHVPALSKKALTYIPVELLG